jgi:hypothetical protein
MMVRNLRLPLSRRLIGYDKNKNQDVITNRTRQCPCGWSCDVLNLKKYNPLRQTFYSSLNAQNTFGVCLLMRVHNNNTSSEDNQDVISAREAV